jgi:hypothetical protein
VKIFCFLIPDCNWVHRTILGTEAKVDTGACPAAGTPPGIGALDLTAAAGDEARGGCTGAEVRSVDADVWAGTEGPGVLGPVESGTGVRVVCHHARSASELAPKGAVDTRVYSFGTAPPEVKE